MLDERCLFDLSISPSVIFVSTFVTSYLSPMGKLVLTLRWIIMSYIVSSSSVNVYRWEFCVCIKISQRVYIPVQRNLSIFEADALGIKVSVHSINVKVFESRVKATETASY